MKRIKDWMLFKNLKRHEKDQIVLLEEQFEESNQHCPALRLRGRPVSHHKIIRHRKAIVRSSDHNTQREALVGGRRQVLDLQLDSGPFGTPLISQTQLSGGPSSSLVPSRLRIPPAPNLYRAVEAPLSLRDRQILFRALDHFTDTMPKDRNYEDRDKMYSKFVTGVDMLCQRKPRVAWSLIQEAFAIVKDVVVGCQRSSVGIIFEFMDSYFLDEHEMLILSLLKHFFNMSGLVLGTHHPITTIYRLLATCQTRKELAESAWEVHIDLFRKKVGVADLDTLQMELGRASNYVWVGKVQEAEPILRRLLDIGKTGFGRLHYFTTNTARTLSWCFRSQGCFSKSEEVLLEILQQSPGDEVGTGSLASIWGNLLLENGTPMANIALRRELAYVRKDQGNYKESEIYLRKILASCLDIYGLSDDLKIGVLDDLERVMIEQGNIEGAEALRAEYPTAFE